MGDEEQWFGRLERRHDILLQTLGHELFKWLGDLLAISNLTIHSNKEARTTIRSIKIQAFITSVYYMAMSIAGALEDS